MNTVDVKWRWGRWNVTATVLGEDGRRPAQTFFRKKEAVTAGRELADALDAELFIYTMDGRYQDRRSFGNDPKGRG